MSVVWDIIKGLFMGILEVLFHPTPPPVVPLKEVQDVEKASDARDAAVTDGVRNPEQYAREPNPNSRD